MRPPDQRHTAVRRWSSDHSDAPNARIWNCDLVAAFENAVNDVPEVAKVRRPTPRIADEAEQRSFVVVPLERAGGFNGCSGDRKGAEQGVAPPECFLTFGHRHVPHDHRFRGLLRFAVPPVGLAPQFARRRKDRPPLLLNSARREPKDWSAPLIERDFAGGRALIRRGDRRQRSGSPDPHEQIGDEGEPEYTQSYPDRRTSRIRSPGSALVTTSRGRIRRGSTPLERSCESLVPICVPIAERVGL
jgi:hypothetical protein